MFCILHVAFFRMAADRELLIYAMDTCDEIRTEAIRGMISLAIGELEVFIILFLF